MSVPPRMVVPPPLSAGRQYCTWCCGSASEVNRCPARSCPLWPFRSGRKPTPEILADAGDRTMYPLERRTQVGGFYEGGGTPLKAIKYLCRDCSGGSKVDVRACSYADCPLHPFRLGKNPNRRMSEEKRVAA